MGKGDRKRRGRPPKQGPRTPSGQLSRAKGCTATLEKVEQAVFEQDVRQTVYQARARHMGEPVTGSLSKPKVQALGLDKRGSALGRWLADGALTAEQVAAGEDYAHRRLRFRQTNGLPPDTAASASYGAVRGGGADPDPDTAVRARLAYRDAERALHRHGVAVTMAMYRACILDHHAPLHLVRIGCDALLAMQRGNGIARRRTG